MQIVIRPRVSLEAEAPAEERYFLPEGKTYRAQIDASWERVRACVKEQGGESKLREAGLPAFVTEALNDFQDILTRSNEEDEEWEDELAGGVESTQDSVPGRLAIGFMEELLPEHREVDFEDFYESAVIVHEALKTGLPVYVVDVKNKTFGVNTDDRFDGEQPFLLLGATGKRDHFIALDGFRWPDKTHTLQAETYWHIAAVRDLMKRDCVTTHVYDSETEREGENGDLVEILLKKHIETGCRAFFLKATEPKFGIWKLELPEDASQWDVQSALFHSMEYDYSRLEARPEGLLVQPQVKWSNEYRVIVVDGEIVTGAGVVTSATPLLSPGNLVKGTPSLSRVVSKTPSSDAVLEDEDGERYVLEHVLPFAEMAVQRIAADCPELLHYTLDVGYMQHLDVAEGEMAIVELNPLQHFGLYGIDYAEAFECIMAYATGRAAKAAADFPL